MKKQLFYILTCTLLTLGVVKSQAQVIITVAGNTVGEYLGDNEAAASCYLHWPEAIALDVTWNVYIADANNNVIRKIDAAGNITTIVGSGFQAGTGNGGFAGDGGPASAARLSYPSGVAVDAAGTKMYIADQRNHRIRMVDLTTMTISTFAGTGVSGFSGDAAAATACKLKGPTRVCVDGTGSVYIADAGNNCIRKVDPSGTINTVAGTGGTMGFNGDGGPAISALLNAPQDMCVDATGVMYIADYNNNRIRKVDAAGTITTFAGNGYPGYSGDNGLATAANLFLPSGIAVDPAGNVFFSDFANARVRKIDLFGVIMTYAGNGTSGYSGDKGLAKNAKINFPQGIAVNGIGGVYIADKGNNRVRFASTTLSNELTEADYPGCNLFPNPSSGSFNVSIPSDYDEPAQIAICDVAGRKLKELNSFTNKQETIAMDAPPGVYFLTVTTPHGNYNEKVCTR